MELEQAGRADGRLIVWRAISQPITIACIVPALAAAAVFTFLSVPSAPLPGPKSDYPAPDSQARRRISSWADAPAAIDPRSSTAAELLERITYEEHLIRQATPSKGPEISWVPRGGMGVLSYGMSPGVAALTPEAQLADDIPLPTPSPLVGSKLPSRPSVAARSAEPVARGDAVPPEDNNVSLLDLLFTPRDYAAKQMLASNRQSAIYDIGARKVYLPGGQALEAHSGFGEWMDNPASVARKSIGVTPPNIYKVSLRPALFHGIRALRLTPEDSSKMFGRNGFLAHPFMLGETGQSNGCVSIKDYDAFLRAFQNGQVTRLIVVPKSDDNVIASANERS